MTMWADNIKFVKDIIDSKYQKIDHAVAEITESSETLLKDAKCAKSKEHLMSGLRTLELVQPSEIEKILETIISELHGKEKEALENEAKTKMASRVDALEKAKQIKAQLKI
eukprot:GFUD01003452.1.p1 GENE.GFUD01003452.1~~GFUD01003452.1.p1  ORF type:complete len:124 (+),score=48.13 GFUD01003452.1:40-372(+)